MTTLTRMLMMYVIYQHCASITEPGNNPNTRINVSQVRFSKSKLYLCFIFTFVYAQMYISLLSHYLACALLRFKIPGLVTRITGGDGLASCDK